MPVGTSSQTEKTVVGVAELAISDGSVETLITYALGSCLGITVYDPEAGIGALIHCLLPSAKKTPEKGEIKPAMFIDTGLVDLMKKITAMGADLDRLVIKVAGGANPIDTSGMFKVGEGNHTMLRRILWQNGLFTDAEDVGGTKPRTLSLEISTGRVLVKTDGKDVEL